MANINEKYDNLPKEKFELVGNRDRITDKKLSTKAIGYFGDAWIRFRKNKSSVAAAIIILLLFLYAIIIPFISHYDVTFRDGYYKMVLPKSNAFSFLGWDGCKVQKEGQSGFDYLTGIGYELDNSAVKEVRERFVDQNTGTKFYNVYVDSYDKVGFTYADVNASEYEKIKAYQNKTGIQVMYPIPNNYKTNFVVVSNGANLWYELADNSGNSNGLSKHHDDEGNPIFVPDYHTSDNKERGNYDSIRIPSDDGGKDGKTWFTYAVKNQSGYRIRVYYKEYYHYKNGFYPYHLLGTNQHGQDILACLASGARLSFLLAISVSLINFIIGIIWGAVSGYYGGVVDLVMERITDVLSSVPFLVVVVLFKLHIAAKVGDLGSLLFAFVLTGWIGISHRVRTQMYRFKNHEYILAARTLGARDRRLIFRHILPNSLGTIITGTVMIIPSVIFSESMLSYLGIINLETSSMTSVGTMLAHGQAYLSTFPHILFFPSVFISLLMISFNLFGNGLRDAFNPSLRGADE